MRKKILGGIAALLIILLLVFVYILFSGATSFSEKSKYLYIRSSDANYESVLKTLKDSQFISNTSTFNFIAKQLDVPNRIKAGRFEIKKGMSLLSIARMLRNNSQSPVKLVIIKLRTKENLSAFLGKRFECDSASVHQFLSSNDSLKDAGLDTNTIMTSIFPNTYELIWAQTPGNLLRRLFAEHKRFWTEEKTALAQSKGLTPTTAYILASIVEEESNAKDEKDTIASVYMNRFKKGMRLQADPTVKFALKDFTLKRIYEKHLLVESPYNTYRNSGFPPGPICTPSLETINAVLQMPSTNYLYFVAKSDFSGRHVFSATYEEHLIKAKEFQQAQDEQQKIKAAREAKEKN